ncbi:MAG: TonB-dependent receptor plug domain-containing protein [Povalibacter sp.]
MLRRFTAAVVFALLFATQFASAADLIGRRVSEVLDELRTHGVTFIYNSEIVTDELRVTVEPAAAEPVEIAREILQVHGLALSQVGPQIYAVVRAPSASSTPAPAPGESAASGAKTRVEEVVVETSRYALATDIEGLHAFLDQQQVAHLPRLGDETLQAVQRLPGVAVNGFSSVSPIRGGAPNETAILLDGLRLYEPFHLKSFLSPVSLLDSRIIAGLDVYFGGFPVNYGDRMSAIIDAHSIRPATDRYYELGLSLFHATALGYGTFDSGRGDVLLSARRSNLGELSQLAENEFGRPDYSDAFARLDYAFDESTHGSLNVLLSHDRVTAIRSSGNEEARYESSNAYVWGTLEHEWSDALKSRAIASFTSVVDERHGEVADPGRRSGEVIDDRGFDVVGLRIENEWNLGTTMHRFGAEVRRLWADYDYSADIQLNADYPFAGFPARETSRSVVLHPDGFEVAGYWDTKLELNKLWTLEGGLRVDTQTYDGSGDAEQWSPRLSILYNATPSTRLRASWGRFYQAQAINELQVEDGVDQFYPAQHANHTIFSIEHAFPSQLDVRLELYRKHYRTLNPRYENLLDPLVLLPEVQFDRVRIAPQTARTDGAELWLNWHPGGHLSGWMSYTWSQAQDQVDGKDVYRSWDQRHAASLGIAWINGPWAATLVDSYHTGWPTTQLTLVSPPPPVGPPVIIGTRNAGRYADFNSLDLRITRTFQMARGQLDVFVEGTNLASRANPCCTEYQLIENEQGNPELKTNTDSWLPLVPSIGVLWRYGK